MRAAGRTASPAAAGVARFWASAAADGAPDASRPEVAAQLFADAVRTGVLDLPLPGGGRTTERWDGLAALGAADVTLGRLAEAHADAAAVLVELGARPAGPGERWGVWAAEPPGARLAAEREGGSWRLTGTKSWCSGASLCTHALVTAWHGEDQRLFAVAVAAGGVSPGTGGWRGVAMTGSDTEDVGFTGAAGSPVGGPGDYLRRPGFWWGAGGVAAVWHGGAVGVARRLLAASRRDEHTLVALGAVDAALSASRALLDATAVRVDAGRSGEADALRLRATVEAAATLVLERTGRALGPGPLAQDRAHARRVADLTVYLRQSHAERDLAALGRRTDGTSW